MIVRTLISLWLLGTLIPLDSQLIAQESHAADLWYFGRGAGLKFSGTGLPLPLTNGALNTLDGSAVISDPVTGKLLFYSNGSTIWNAQHKPMPNGTGLLSDESSGQPALIIPYPGSKSRYFLFTTGSRDVSNRTLRYNIIDMALDGGKGDVVEKNVLLLERGSEKMTATRHCNGEEYWMVTQEWGTNRFMAYRITASGIDQPVVSSLGSQYPNGDDVQGTIHLSPDGSMVAVTSAGLEQLALLDFDPATGLLDNYRIIGTGKNYYGGEFSPDQSRFYAITLPHNVPAELIQFDLEQPDPATINSTQITLAQQEGTWPGGQLQIGPDGAIYVSFTGRAFLGRIAFPNLVGTACQYLHDAIGLGGKVTSYGLPNFIDSDLPNVESSIHTVDISLLPSTSNAVPGELVEITLQVCNRKSSPLSPLNLVVNLPNGITYESGLPSFPLVSTGTIQGDACAEIKFRGKIADTISETRDLEFCAEVDVDQLPYCTTPRLLCGNIQVGVAGDPCPEPSVVLTDIPDRKAEATGSLILLPVDITGFPSGEMVESFDMAIKFDGKSTTLDLEDEDDMTDESLTEDWDVSLLSNENGLVKVQLNRGSGNPITSDGTLLFIPIRLYIPTGESFPETDINATFTLPNRCVEFAEGTGFAELDICGLDWRRVEALNAGRFSLSTPTITPSMDRVELTYTLPVSSHASLTLFSLTGTQIASLVDEIQAFGQHTIVYSIANLPNGLYIVRLQTPEWRTERVISIYH